MNRNETVEAEFVSDRELMLEDMNEHQMREYFSRERDAEDRAERVVASQLLHSNFTRRYVGDYLDGGIGYSPMQDISCNFYGQLRGDIPLWLHCASLITTFLDRLTQRAIARRCERIE